MRLNGLWAIGLAFFAASVFAQKATPHEYCKDQASAAGVLMKARQDGVLLQDMMEALKDEPDKAIKIVAQEVYKRPIANTKDGKKRAVDEFQNEMYGVCINASSK